MSMKPTLHLRFVNREVSVPVPGANGFVMTEKRKTLQQKWIDEADARIFDWRDVEVIDEVEQPKKDELRVYY